MDIMTFISQMRNYLKSIILQYIQHLRYFTFYNISHYLNGCTRELIRDDLSLRGQSRREGGLRKLGTSISSKTGGLQGLVYHIESFQQENFF